MKIIFNEYGGYMLGIVASILSLSMFLKVALGVAQITQIVMKGFLG